MNLDPCGCIVNFTNVEDLYLTADSKVTEITKIYYFGEEIQECLSPIIGNTNYHDVLFDLAPPTISFINELDYNKSIGLYDLLLDAIYITQLTVISKEIEGTQICSNGTDEVEMCSLRIDYNECGNVTLSVGENMVAISDNVTCAVSDIIVINTDPSINLTEPNEGAAAELYEEDDGTECVNSVIENSVTINMLTGDEENNQSNSSFDTDSLSVPITFTFPCSGVCDDSFQCIWWDAETETWDTAGCNTSINHEVCWCFGEISGMVENVKFTRKSLNFSGKC